MAARPKIVVTNPVFSKTRARLDSLGEVVVNESLQPWTKSELIAHAGDADALLAFMTDCVDADLLNVCKNLKIVAGALKGYDNLDADACSARGIWLTVVPDLLTAPTAELAVALTLGLNRNVLSGDAHVRTGQFEGWRAELYGFGLDGANVGIAGLGRVGLETARRLRGFGCKLFGFDKVPVRAPTLEAFGIEFVNWELLLSTSDVLILALPLSDGTLHLVDAEALEQMRREARIINVGRGSVVDEEAVSMAIREGRISGYAADVFEFEDWARVSRPRRIPQFLLDQGQKVLFTPHLGSAVTSVRQNIELAAVDNIKAVFDGRRPPDAVNEPKRMANF
jgi:phosphonate dehydrogenase